MHNFRDGPGLVLALTARSVITVATVVMVIVLFAILLIIKISSLVVRELFRTFLS